ncbi:SRPBCC family protein [Phytohabitans sp. ZYX-F-186]|uniref:SRPBCC family protein n=1 Tax=Phytohabitans maris TaxID=3071409 RepID=A0ABU0ZBW7_9ACTN|nr:SRPBCC family protein [Phytohabitans sp. ZYX-F-186]MDQ7903846.1 SRPBCC family protein [Phytohabitans sp. ZYX-F-186]
MTALTSTIEIARPPEEVFAYATDPTHFPRWQADVLRVDLGEGWHPAVGARFTTTRRVGGAERTMTQRVTELNHPYRWAVEGIAGPIRPNASVTVEPLDGGGSRVTFTLDFTGHGVGVALAPMVRRLAAKGAPASYASLKRLLEGGA